MGKTCLATLFVDHRVIERSTNTIGFDHHVKDVVVEEGVPVKVRGGRDDGEGREG